MAGEDDAERLIVLLEARIRDFEKNLQKASGTADRSYGRMRKDSRSATRQMEQDMIRSTSRINQALAATSTKIGAYGKAFVGGLVGGVVAGGVAGVVEQIGHVANSIAQIGDEAKRAGVSARAFQEWKFVAEQNRIGIDQMTDGLKELNLRADEFVLTGKGSAAEAFQRLGYTAQDLKKKLADPSALLLEIIDRLGKFDKAAQIRISDELFGGSAGERFVELLDQGEKGIRTTIERAHELGIVLDDEMIKKAAEIDKRFNEISNTVGMNLKSAIVAAADSLAEFIDGFREFENQRNRTLTNKVADIDRERLDLENQILAIRQKQREETGIYAEHERRMLGGQISALEDQRKALSEDSARIEAILTGRSTQAMARTASREWTPPKPPPGGFGGGGGGRDKETAQAERQAEAVRRLIDELETELELVGKSDAVRRTTETLRRAGAAVTEEQALQIERLIYQIEAETAALDKQKKAQEARTEALSSMFDMGTDALTSIVDGSLKAEDAVKKLAVQLALAAAQAALLGTGPLSGLFGGGGLFGGFAAAVDPWAGLRNVGFSSGTANTGGQRGQPRGIVHGQEAVIPLPNGGKVPVQMQGGGAPAGGSSVLEVRLSAELVGQILKESEGQSVRIAQETTKAGIREYDRGTNARVVNAVREASRRNVQF